MGLAGIVVGAVAAPLWLWWQIQLSLRSTPAGIPITSNMFIDFTFDVNGKWSFAGKAAWFVTAILGANVGGMVGVILGLIISKLRNSRGIRNYRAA